MRLSLIQDFFHWHINYIVREYYIHTEISITFITLTGGDTEVEYNIPDQLKQHFIILPTKLRLVTLLSFLSEKRTKKVIVFLSCKDSVEFHYEITSAGEDDIAPHTRVVGGQ